MPKSKKKVSKSTNNTVKKEVEEVKTNTKNTTSKSKATSKPKNKINNKAAREQNKNEKNKRWFKEFKAELKKIIWPSKSELMENTIVVLSMVIIVATIIFVLDLAFRSLTNLEIKGAKQIKDSISVSTDETNTEAVDAEGSEESENGTEIELTNELVNDVEAVWTDDTTGETVNNE